MKQLFLLSSLLLLLAASGAAQTLPLTPTPEPTPQASPSGILNLPELTAVPSLFQALPVRLREIDGSPNVSSVATINVPNGSLACSGQNCTLTYATSSGVPGGSNTQVQYNNAGAFGGISGATTNGTVLTLTAPVINVGSDADGDIYYRSGGLLTRLPKGTGLQQLRMNAGATAPEWATIAAGTTINSTDGVLPYRSSSTAFADSPITRESSTAIRVNGSVAVGAGTTSISGNVALRVEPLWTGSPGGFDRAMYFRPSFDYNVGTNAVGFQNVPSVRAGRTVPTLFATFIQPNSVTGDTGTITTFYGVYVAAKAFGTVTTPYVFVSEAGAGNVGFGTTAPSVPLHVVGSSAATNTLVDVARFAANSTGTAAAGFGSQVTLSAESSTTDDQAQAAISSAWSDATHATRSGYLSLSTVNSGTLAERIRVTADGRLYGTALHNNAGAVTGTANQYVASGTYTPTLTNVTNVDASTAYACQWMRVGNVVTVSGQVDIDVTLTASAATELGISLPIASNFTAAENLGGDAVSDAIASLSARIRADATNDRAAVVFKAISPTNDTYSFTFTYVVQ